MNYAYQYFKIITNRTEHPISMDDCYVEKHHIIPKSEGGSNKADNLVNLTAREHYVCHLLLAKIYDDSKMWSAIHFMMYGNKHQRNVKISSKEYELIRKNNSLVKMAFHHSEETKQRISNQMRGVKKSLSTRQKMSVAAMGKKKMLGHKHTRETLEKMSASAKGRIISESTRMKLREALRGGHWYTNGITDVLAQECPEGFTRGRSAMRGRPPWNKGKKKSKKMVNDNNEEIEE